MEIVGPIPQENLFKITLICQALSRKIGSKVLGNLWFNMILVNCTPLCTNGLSLVQFWMQFGLPWMPRAKRFKDCIVCGQQVHPTNSMCLLSRWSIRAFPSSLTWLSVASLVGFSLPAFKQKWWNIYYGIVLLPSLVGIMLNQSKQLFSKGDCISE